MPAPALTLTGRAAAFASSLACLQVETMVNLRQLLVEQEPSLADSLGLFAAPIDMVRAGWLPPCLHAALPDSPRPPLSVTGGAGVGL